MGRGAVELVLAAGAEIGESPVWDPDSGELLWVDILLGLVNRFDPRTGKNRSFAIGQPVGAVACCLDGDLLLAVRDGFAVLDSTGQVRPVVDVEGSDSSARMNDGACDARGRYWAGTTTADRRPGAGSVYRLAADGSVDRVLTGVTLPNGIDWSPNGRTMYFTDSATGCVDAFDFDLASGKPSNRRHLIEIPEADGTPDGLTVDAAGFLWVALYRGGSVRRYTPTGTLDLVIELPVKLVTSCAFGDADLKSLYITTATRGLDSAALVAQPGAGGLFRVRPPGVAGVLSNRFG